MAEATREIDIKVMAKDEASGVFDKIKLKAKAMAAEERETGGTALEKLLKGGGAFGLATFAAEEVTKFGKASQEAFQGYIDGTEKAGEGTKKLLESIPVFGRFYEAAESLVGAAEDGAAAFAKWTGASDATVKSLESYDTQIARSNATIKENIQLQDMLAKAHEEMKKAARGDLEGVAKEQQEIKDRFAKELEETRKKTEKLKEEHPNDAKQIENVQEHVEIDLKKAQAAELAAVDRKSELDQEKFAQDSAKRIGDIESKARQDRLRALHEDLQAELEQIKQAAQDKIEQGQKEAAAAKKKLLPDDAVGFKRINDQVAKENDAIKSEQAAAIAAATDKDAKKKTEEAKRAAEEQSKKVMEDARRRAEFQRAEAQGEMEMLQRRAALGDKNAALDAAKIRTAEEYREKQEAIYRLMQGASDEEKKQGQGIIGRLENEKRESLAFDAIKDQVKSLREGPKYAGAEQLVGGGILDMQRERDKGKQNDELKTLIAHAKAQADAAKDTNKKMDDVIKHLSEDDGGFDSELT